MTIWITNKCIVIVESILNMAKVVYRELFNNLEFFNTRLSFSQKSKLLRELNAKQKVAF